MFRSRVRRKKENKHKSFLDYRNKNTEANWQNYRLCREQLVSLVNDKHEKYSLSFISILSENQEKWFFGSCSSNSRIMAKRSSFNEMITQDFQTAVDFIFVFSNLGEFFRSVKFEPNVPVKSEFPAFHFKHIIVKQCYYVNRALNVECFLRPSTVPAWAKIDNQSIIVTHLTFVIDACIDDKVFPSELNKVNVKTLFEKSDPLSSKNYGPFQ